jgi:regulatory protein
VKGELDAAQLQRVTAWYLERWATSAEHLRRLLLARLERAGVDRRERESLVAAEIDRLRSHGWLDDERYAADRVRTLRRKGGSAAKVRATLRAKGVDAGAIDGALAAGDETEWDAACTWARKHRVGRWRRAEADVDVRRKELARLGRAGFPYDLARRIVDDTDSGS